MAVSIEDYGAIPDWNGTSGTDNTAAIQAAIATGARSIHVPAKPFRIADAIVLGEGQQLVGEKGGLYTLSRSLPQSLLALRTGEPRKVAIRNARETRGQGIHGLTLELDDPTHVGVQFTGSYGNLIENLTFFGTFDVGITLHDSYVCRLQDVVVCGCRVRRAIVYVGSSNAVTIANLHTSAFPYDAATCMRAIAIHGGGRGYSIQSPVLQGATIGLHVHPGVMSLEARDIYTENTVCGVRLGEGNEGPHAVTLQGVFGAPYPDHPQIQSAGPNIWFEAGHAVRILPSRFDSPPEPRSPRGPWPILCGEGAVSLAIDPQSGFRTPSETDLVFRQSLRAQPALEMTSAHAGGRDTIVAGPLSGGMHTRLRIGPDGKLAEAAWAPEVIAGQVSRLLVEPMPSPEQVLV